jgi:hypothetical protein
MHVKGRTSNNTDKERIKEKAETEIIALVVMVTGRLDSSKHGLL